MIEEFIDMARLTEDLGFLLARVSGEVARQANAALAGEGLRVRQYSVLALACDAQGGISQRRLAQMLALDPSQVVALVDEMADAGLVERHLVPGDRRTRLVTATQTGHRKRECAAVRAAAGLREALRLLSGDEQETLRMLLSRVAGDALGATDQPDI